MAPNDHPLSLNPDDYDDIDIDDPDNPELTEEFFARAKPMREVFGEAFVAKWQTQRAEFMAQREGAVLDNAIILVRLLNEDVDVWRPVRAQRLSEATFRLSDLPMPDEEKWSFQPGDIVVVEHKADGSGLVAVARATDIDERSQAPYALAG